MSLHPRRPSRRTMLGRAAAGLGLLATTAAISACGGSGGNQTPTGSTQVTGGGKPVDLVTWGLPAEPVSMDPAFAYDFETDAVLTNVLDSLMRFGPEGELLPGLAESMEEDGNRALVYRLREGVTFHDGSELTSRDVVASLRRHLDPDLGSYFGGYFVNVRDISATGPYEVRIDFKRPDYALKYMMATMAGAITSERFIEEAGDRLGDPKVGVVGTGPYRFDSWTSGREVVVERFDDYWDEDVPRAVRRGVFSVVGDTQTLLAALRTGEIDGSFRVTGRDAASVEGFGSVNVLTAPGLGYQGVAFNMRKPGGPFASTEARRALLHATDRQGVLDAAWGGHGDIVDALVPPAAWSYARPIYEAAYDELPAGDHDVEEAQRLAQEAGLDGASATLIYSAGNPQDEPAALGVQAAAESLGVDLEVRALSQTQFFNQLNQGATGRKGGDWDLSLALWAPDFADPLTTYAQMQSSSPANSTGFDDPAFDREVARAVGEVSDDDARAEHTVAAQARVADAVPTWPLYAPDAVLALNKRLGGMEATPLYYWTSWLGSLSGV